MVIVANGADSKKVWLATGEQVDADLLLVGALNIANAWGISIQRFKQLTKEGRDHPGGQGIYFVPDLLPMVFRKEYGREVYVLTAERAMEIYQSEIALAAERPDSKHDEAGVIVGKTYRTRRSDVDSSRQPRKPKPGSKNATGKSRE
jgi:hypothetical protein